MKHKCDNCEHKYITSIGEGVCLLNNNLEQALKAYNSETCPYAEPKMTSVDSMNLGTACAIFEQLDSDKYTDEEKAVAIYRVMNMPTHNSITKDYMLKAIKWLFDKCYEVKGAI